jgi:hypothetical protein
MSMPINDGGSAFPLYLPQDEGDIRDGMTLRDWFAGQALPLAWELEQKFPCGEDNSPSYKGTASRAFLFADAMIAARKEKP